MKSNIYVFLVSSKQGFGSRICFKINFLYVFRTPTTMTTTKTWWTTPRTRSTRSRSSKEKGKNISANANEDPLVTRELRVLKVSFTKKNCFEVSQTRIEMCFWLCYFLGNELLGATLYISVSQTFWLADHKTLKKIWRTTKSMKLTPRTRKMKLCTVKWTNFMISWC